MRALGWLLNGVYAALLAAAAPWVLWRMFAHGRYRRGGREKLWGLLPTRPDRSRPRLWLHAVSVGEVLLLRSLTARLRAARPEVEILVSTSTDAGYDVAQRELPDCAITFAPLDFTWATRRAVARVQPDLVALVELELWPNLLRQVGAAGVPLALVNGRLSDRSARRYRWIRWLLRPLLANFRWLAVQTDEHAARFLDLGVDPGRVVVAGSIKFDGVATDRRNERTERLRRLLLGNDGGPVFVAGSTQSPEEAAALDAWLAARERFPQSRLILVPRHRERFEEVAALIAARGCRVLRRSELCEDEDGSSAAAAAEGQGAPPVVILVDTLGELGAVWGLADVAYVGGSLTPGRGGQNMLEPAAYGAAVLFGPCTENFRGPVTALLAADAAAVVATSDDLKAGLAALLDAPARIAELGANAQRVVLSHQGATERTVNLLVALLPPVHAVEADDRSQPAAADDAADDAGDDAGDRRVA